MRVGLPVSACMDTSSAAMLRNGESEFSFACAIIFYDDNSLSIQRMYEPSHPPALEPPLCGDDQ